MEMDEIYAIFFIIITTLYSLLVFGLVRNEREGWRLIWDNICDRNQFYLQTTS